MIAHRIKKSSAQDKFGRLACYVMDTGRRLDPAHFQRLADYVVDRRGDRGERVVGARATNCSTDDLFIAIKTIEATQAENQRSRAEKSYHLVISFREGERPALETLRAIEDELCAAIGFTDHERISAIHDDTDNLHIHVAINKVHPVTFRNVEPYYDMPKLMTACIELEAKYGLQVDNHGAQAERRMTQTARKMEVYSGRESLQTWIAANAMPALDEITASAGSWADVQAGSAKFGLEIRARGAGLVIGQIGEALCVKASSISPNLAHKALTERFGPFERSMHSLAEAQQALATPTADKSYAKGPRQREGLSKDLWARYQTERSASQEARNVAHAALNADFAKYDADLRAYHKQRRSHIQALLYLAGADRRAMYKRLDEERRDDWAKRHGTLAEQRAAVNARHPLPTWQAFLQRGAELGDEAALGVLRSQVAFRRKAGADVLMAADMAAARDVIFRRLDPRARREHAAGLSLDLKADRNGDLVYRVTDGGRVTDTKGEVRCDALSAYAAFLTLSIAAEKFPGQALVIAGTQAFKGAVIGAASLPGWDIRFADPVMEAARGAMQSEAQVARGLTKIVSATVTQSDHGRSIDSPEHDAGMLR